MRYCFVMREAASSQPLRETRNKYEVKGRVDMQSLHVFGQSRPKFQTVPSQKRRTVIVNPDIPASAFSNRRKKDYKRTAYGISALLP
ncbi:hypothetical protein CEXT_513441 [Caerostris extrusa]|uniref:Uncharacterized protein n=1 Tax=Caerostris extrusa TaxID=172846 RepID=A0AAV4WIQ5_CAEEX|nr:hypothetical protein CEXT_513441 [Caerostris extrusa]